MPDGGRSMYADMQNGQAYFTYLTEELPAYLKAVFHLNLSRENTLIAGLSMGGFGTVFHAFRHPDKFCVAYSMSGAVGGMGTATCPSLERIFTDEGYTPADYGRLPELTLECGTED